MREAVPQLSVLPLRLSQALSVNNIMQEERAGSRLTLTSFSKDALRVTMHGSQASHCSEEPPSWPLPALNWLQPCG